MTNLLLSALFAVLLAQPALAQVIRVGSMTPPGLSSGGGSDVSSMMVRARGAATLRYLTDIVTDEFNIKDSRGSTPGAVGDGAADDTAAIQATYDAACNAAGANPSGHAAWGSFQVVRWPAGSFYISGVDSCPMVLTRTAGQGQTRIFLKNGANRSAIRITNLPSNFDSTYSLFTPAFIKGLTIYGNGANQTGSSPCIEAQDDPYAGRGVRRESSFVLQDVLVVGCKGDGIYNGNDRNAPYLDRVTALSVGGHGWHIANNSFDAFAINSGFGQSGGAGIQQDSGSGCTQIVNTSAWLNQTAGVNLDSGFGCYFKSFAGSFDRNYGPGLIDASAAPVSMVTPNFAFNNYGTAGTNPHILFSGSGALSIESPSLSGNRLIGQPTYFIQSTGSGASARIVVTGTTTTVGPDAPWSTSQYSAANVFGGSGLYGFGANSAGTDYQIGGGLSTGSACGGDTVAWRAPAGTAGRSLNGAVEALRIRCTGGIVIRETTQFQGLFINKDANGNSIAGIIGVDTGNDGGTLKLWKGGTANVQLSASNSVGSYFNQNIAFGSTSSPTAPIDDFGAALLRGDVAMSGLSAAGAIGGSLCRAADGITVVFKAGANCFP